MNQEKLMATLAELEQELGRAQQQENAARVARLRLEGAVAVLKQLLQDDQVLTQPAGGQEEVTDGSNH